MGSGYSTDIDDLELPKSTTEEEEQQEHEEETEESDDSQYPKKTGYDKIDSQDPELSPEVKEDRRRRKEKQAARKEIHKKKEAAKAESKGESIDIDSVVDTPLWFTLDLHPDTSYEDAIEAGWDKVRDRYRDAEDPGKPENKGDARSLAVDLLCSRHSWLNVTDEKEDFLLYNENTGRFEDGAQQELSRILETRLKRYYNKHELSEVTGRVKARNHTESKYLNASNPDEFGSGQQLTCVGNGVIDAESGELLEHSPEYQFTRGIDIDYNEDADTSTMLDFLDDITQREADRNTILDHAAMGVFLDGHPARAFLVLSGKGSNGKTVLMNVLRELVGSENAASEKMHDLSEDPYSTSNLSGCHLNLGDDMKGDDGSGQIQDISLLKQITGSSPFTVKEKYVGQYDTVPEAANFFSTNSVPRIKSDRLAIADRLYPIPFEFDFVPDPDPDDPMQKQRVQGFEDELTNDRQAMEGLLSLLVKHAKKLAKNGCVYAYPESAEERLEMYNMEADPLDRFSKRFFKAGEKSDVIQKIDVYRAYERYCEINDEVSTSERAFARNFRSSCGFDIESGQSRRFGDSDRDSVYKRIRFDDSATQFLSDFRQDRYSYLESPEGYSDDSESNTDANTDGEGNALELSTCSLGTKQQSVKVKFTKRMPNPAPYLDGEGYLEGCDDGGLIKWIARGGESVFDECEEGDTLRLTNFKLGTDQEEDRQLTAIEGVTQLKVIGEDRQIPNHITDDYSDDDDDPDSGSQSNTDSESEPQDTDKTAGDTSGNTHTDSDSDSESESEPQPHAQRGGVVCEDIDTALLDAIDELGESRAETKHPIDDVIESLSLPGVSEKQVRERIEKLKDRGEVYTPAPGQIRRVY